MVDISDTLIAKSDQLNADDLIGRTLTIKITRVTGSREPEQPLNVYYDGDNGKPYKPGKSMRRVLGMIWGKESDQWIGRSMTLYRDPEIMFGKLKVGGIRISHMEGLDEDRTLALTATKGAKRAFVVKPLRVQQQRQAEPMPADVERLIADASTQDELIAIRADSEQKPFWPAVDQATRRRKAAIEEEQQQNADQGRGGADHASDGGRDTEQGGDDGYDGI